MNWKMQRSWWSKQFNSYWICTICEIIFLVGGPWKVLKNGCIFCMNPECFDGIVFLSEIIVNRILMISIVINTIINILLLFVIIIIIIIIIIVIIIIIIIIIIIVVITIISISTVFFFFPFSSFEFNFVRLIFVTLCRQSVKSIGQKRLPSMVPSQFLFKRLKPLQIISFEH